MGAVIEERGLIYDAATASETERVAFFTALHRTSAGEWLCCFQVGPTKQAATSQLGLCSSSDGGRTWQRRPLNLPTTQDGIPGSLGTGEIIEPDPGRLLLFATWFDRSDPTRPLFDPDTEGILPSRLLIAESLDGGREWSSWRRLDTRGLTGCAGTGPALRWSDGTLGLAFESFKEYHETGPARHAAWLLLSRDGGRTFPELFRTAHDPNDRLYYWDQRLCVDGPSGEYVALFWTHDRGLAADLSVHLSHGSLAAPPTAAPAATGIPGQIAAPVRLPDGRLAALVVDRDRPGEIRLWQSSDNGAAWPREQSLQVHAHDEQARLTQGLSDIDFAQYWEDMARWTFGHPALQLLDDNHVLAAYYAGDPSRMSIHWARIRL